MRYLLRLALPAALLLLWALAPACPAKAGERPEVVDHYPADGQTGVPVNAKIRVVFSEDMDEDSVEDGITLEDEDGDEVDGDVTYDAETREAVFEPDDPLEYNTEYRVEVSRSVKDEDGDRLRRSYRWTFTTVKTARVLVDGVEVPGESIRVNNSPVDIKLETSGAEKVTWEGRELRRRRGDFFLDGVWLEPGENDFSFVITYDDEETVTVNKTVNFVNLPEAGATATLDLAGDTSFSLFSDRLELSLPDGYYLRRDRVSAPSQCVALRLVREDKVQNAPAAGYVVEIAPLPEPEDDYGGYDLDGVFDDEAGDVTAPPGGEITLPCDEYLSEAAFRTVTVFFDPRDGLAGNWRNLGGRADPRSKAVTVPFQGFGRYVPVNRVWSFRDFSASWWARPYVELLWARGYMSPLPGASAGYFGLVDGRGKEVQITRGEFTAVLAKALGLKVPDEYRHVGVFSDLFYMGGYAFARQQNGQVTDVPREHVKYIEAAATAGFVDGSRDSRGGFVFNYFAPLTREQAAKIIAAAAGLSVDMEDQRVTLWNLARKFRDYRDISPWARPYVLAAANAGYFRGYADWTFRPRDNITRAQAAKLIYTLMEKKRLL